MTADPSSATTTADPSIALVIDVAGEAIPQGSMIPVKRGTRIVLISDNPRLRAWRAQVVAAVKARMALTGTRRIDGPVTVAIDAYLTRPAAARGRRWPHVRPDVDKVARAILDALTEAAVIEDDARVVDLQVRKHYAVATAGVRIVIRAAHDTGELAL